jgi:hypothetical protein
MMIRAAFLLLLASPPVHEDDLWKALDDPRASMERIRIAAGPDPAKVLERLRPTSTRNWSTSPSRSA